MYDLPHYDDRSNGMFLNHSTNFLGRLDFNSHVDDIGACYENRTYIRIF